MATDLCGAVLGSALRGTQLATAFALFVLVGHVGRLSLAHLVLLAGNGRVNGVLLGAGVWMRLEGRVRAGLASAGSKQMFS